MTYKEAEFVARQALKESDGDRPEEVYLPLGLEAREVQAYKVLKPSAFVFRTPEQRRKVINAFRKFEETCDCGPELLSQRRSYDGRRQGSLVDVAEAVYAFIRAKGDNITRELNLTRSFQALEEVRTTHLERLRERKRQVREALCQAINSRNLVPAARRTGYYLRSAEGDPKTGQPGE